MTELDRLLKGHQVPPVPAGLAQRAVAEAVQYPQEMASAPAASSRRRDRRGGWKRPLWISTASFGLAFTSAVAATVVSGGRIEIPVVQQVVEAIPILDEATKRSEPKQRAAEAAPVKEPAAIAEAVPEVRTPGPAPGEPGWRKARVMQKMAVAKQHVEDRRAAGLPTPRADRIETQAKQIVERRQAAGLPTPTIEEVEAGLALREMRRMWVLRRAGRFDPSMLTDQQLVRIADRLPPEKRERFMALPPDQQRQLVAHTLERMRARRAMRPDTPEAALDQTAPVEPVEPENAAR